MVAIEQFTLNTFKWFFGSDDAEAQKVLTQFQSALGQADVAVKRPVGDHRRKINLLVSSVRGAKHGVQARRIAADSNNPCT